MKAFSDFVLWEANSRDTIDFKKIYVDMAQGDIVAGLVLSEIVYWYLPDRNGKTKLRVEHDGQHWIAAPRIEWWDRCRITPRQSDRALRTLKKEGLIATHVYKFNNNPTVHIRIVEECFIPTWDQHIIEPKQNPFLLDGENDLFNQTVKTVDLTNPLNLVTEITTEDTKNPDTPTAVGTPASANAELSVGALEAFGFKVGQVAYWWYDDGQRYIPGKVVRFTSQYVYLEAVNKAGETVTIRRGPKKVSHTGQTDTWTRVSELPDLKRVIAQHSYSMTGDQGVSGGRMEELNTHLKEIRIALSENTPP